MTKLPSRDVPAAGGFTRVLAKRYWPIDDTRRPCLTAACPTRTRNASGYCAWCREKRG